MSTRTLAYSGVFCALASICIIMSSLLHIISPLVISCFFFYICAKKCGNGCSTIVIIASNLIGFLVGGIGGGEIIISILLFSPLSILVYLTSPLCRKLWQVALRAFMFAAFACLIYVLFVTVLKDVVSIGDLDLGVGLYAFGVIWTVVITIFAFALDKGCTIIAKRFFKND